MFAWWGKKQKARRVPDGQFEKRKCPECGKTTVFRECLVKNKYTAYTLIKLWESESTKFACDACGSLVDLDDTDDPELSEREKKNLLKEQEKKQKELAAAAEKARDKAAANAAKKDEAIDDELARMKKDLGL